ncbi:MAG: hypothetical protein HY979_03220 [Candidatus Magasanikbacteria bacterium]|nr:hypothetical protein [Candidatus Magasanikbacteria bacterium]
MKIKAQCPHCQMWQMFRANELGSGSEVRCKMDWCKQTFDSSKMPQKTPHPDHEVLKRA